MRNSPFLARVRLAIRALRALQSRNPANAYSIHSHHSHQAQFNQIPQYVHREECAVSTNRCSLNNSGPNRDTIRPTTIQHVGVNFQTPLNPALREAPSILTYIHPINTASTVNARAQRPHHLHRVRPRDIARWTFPTREAGAASPHYQRPQALPQAHGRIGPSETSHCPRREQRPRLLGVVFSPRHGAHGDAPSIAPHEQEAVNQSH